jgi:hypothetical protein
MEIPIKLKEFTRGEHPVARRLFYPPSNETPVMKFYQCSVQPLQEVKNSYGGYNCPKEISTYVDKPSSEYAPFDEEEDIPIFNKLELKAELKNICTFIDTQDTGYYLQDMIEEKLEKLLITFKTHTLPSKPCYINNLPIDLFQLILTFTNPWDLYNIITISKLFKKEIYKIIDNVNEYYCVGRVLNFAHNNTWNTGIILCNSIYYNEYHVLLPNTKVISISKSIIVKFSCCNRNRIPPKDDFKYNATTHCCNSNPHEVNSEGYRTGTFSSKIIPHYTCNILNDSVYLLFNENMIGMLYDISKLPLHRNHRHLCFKKK